MIKHYDAINSMNKLHVPIFVYLWLHWTLFRLPNNVDNISCFAIQVLITVPNPQSMGFIFDLHKATPFRL